MNPLNSALLIWDYTPHATPVIPPALLPSNTEIVDEAEAHKWALNKIRESGQLVGSPLDILCEISGRTCYDSFGRGRPSAGYHSHLLEVKHGSVHEHAVITVEVSFPHEHRLAVMEYLLNRPGVFVIPGRNGVRITFNLRALYEWDSFTYYIPVKDMQVLYYIRDLLCMYGHLAAPQVCAAVELPTRAVDVSAVLVEPVHLEEKWVSLFLTGSRGFTHELVRHKYRTAVSQRSTRYVDENESQWVDHPLILEYTASEKVERAGNGEQTSLTLRQRLNHVRGEAKRVYKACVEALEPWLIAKGVEKVTARKQARGAARGYLGNALYTECVFSASVAQWRRMLQQRANPAADAEIRDVFCQALEQLKLSRYAADFADMHLTPSPDGLGYVVEIRKEAP